MAEAQSATERLKHGILAMAPKVGQTVAEAQSATERLKHYFRRALFRDRQRGRGTERDRAIETYEEYCPSRILHSQVAEAQSATERLKLLNPPLYFPLASHGGRGTERDRAIETARQAQASLTPYSVVAEAQSATERLKLHLPLNCR